LRSSEARPNVLRFAPDYGGKGIAMIKDVLQVGGILVFTGALFGLRTMVLSFDVGKRRKRNAQHCTN
jgi:hypothetical protein